MLPARLRSRSFFRFLDDLFVNLDRFLESLLGFGSLFFRFDIVSYGLSTACSITPMHHCALSRLGADWFVTNNYCHGVRVHLGEVTQGHPGTLVDIHIECDIVDFIIGGDLRGCGHLSVDDQLELSRTLPIGTLALRVLFPGRYCWRKQLSLLL